MKPKVGGNTTIVKQEREISEAEWIPVDQFLEAGSGKFNQNLNWNGLNFETEHNTVYLRAYLDDLKHNRILTPHQFTMKYQHADRHMLMYTQKEIN